MEPTTELTNKSDDYEKIEQAIRFIETNFKEQPDLDTIASAVHLSKYHFHRLFKRWAGVTPNQFLQYLTIGYSKKLLRESHSVFDASLNAGLSSGSRLHDLFITFDAVTPGEYKKYGRGLEINFGYHPTPFGKCLLAKTRRGIFSFRFISNGEQNESIKNLQGEWPEAKFIESPSSTVSCIEKIFSTESSNSGFHLDLKGTNFQVQVWQALLRIPSGAIVSYQDVADYIGKPSSTRAVANAIAKNPIAYLIPCHRVISKSGKIHNYRWGTSRKKALIGWESSKSNLKSLVG